MKEVWKDIENYEGLYQVSSIGRIKSLERTVYAGSGRTRIQRERLLTNSINDNGYYRVNLWRNNIFKVRKVHRLQMEAFVPNPENKRTVNHKNGIKTDNRLCNMEWATHSENNQHAWDNGLNKKHRYEKGIKIS
jgi:hypothetical protein